MAATGLESPLLWNRLFAISEARKLASYDKEHSLDNTFLTGEQ